MPLLHPAPYPCYTLLCYTLLCARSSRASLQRASYSADDAARIYLSFHHPAIGGTAAQYHGPLLPTHSLSLLLTNRAPRPRLWAALERPQRRGARAQAPKC